MVSLELEFPRIGVPRIPLEFRQMGRSEIIVNDRDLLENVATQVTKLANNVEVVTAQVAKLTNNMEIVAAQVAKLTNNMDKLANEVSDIKTDLGSVKTDLGSVKATVIRIEHDHGEKLGALFDGYAQVLEQQTKMSETLADHTIRLERIEEKLAAHDIRITVLDKTKAEKRKVR
jgi:chromosome segregation ATPase